MDCVKTGNIGSPNLWGEHCDSENKSCFLEEDDIPCGHVVYSERSMVLKFVCTDCNQVFDNIELFCKHLGEHMSLQSEETANVVGYKEDIPTDEEGNITNETNSGEFLYDNLELDATNVSGHEPGSFQQWSVVSEDNSDNVLPDNSDALSNASDMIIEELDSCELQDSLTNGELVEELGTDMYAEDREPSYELNEVGDLSSPAEKQNNSFEDCFLKETNIEKIRTQGVCVIKENNATVKKEIQKRKLSVQDLRRLRCRRKKVTTVKVIAVKNRIAELYERIKKQQVDSQQIFTSNVVEQPSSESPLTNEQDTQDAVETLAEGLNEDSRSNEQMAPETHDITRKIIGETLITLIPEGTKIPTILPSPQEHVISNVHQPQIALNNTNDLLRNTTNDKKAVCPACGKVFRSHFSLTIHKRIHYLESDSSVKLAHKCSDCDQLFNKLSQLKQHVESVHYPEGFICKICNRKLSSLSLLERHMVKVHLDRPFNCQTCGKNFSDPMTYEEHLVSHTSGESYKCNICGRKYGTQFFLLEHMRNHKEQIPQTCVVCGKVTLRITQHMKIHTPRPKRLLSCSVCGKVFNFSSGLSHHFKIMHKLPRPPPKPKKEPNQNAPRRKRKPRCGEKEVLKNCDIIVDMPQQNAFDDAGQIIEEPSEIPEEIYNEDETQAILHLTPATEQSLPQHSGVAVHEHMPHILQEHEPLADEEVMHKEEEAKRVIVELIQNSSYTTFFPDNMSSVLEVTPPIAREETISAVNSIVHDC